MKQPVFVQPTRFPIVLEADAAQGWLFLFTLGETPAAATARPASAALRTTMANALSSKVENRQNNAMHGRSMSHVMKSEFIK